MLWGWIMTAIRSAGTSKNQSRLDDLQPLVHQGRRVHRDLRPHGPVGVGQGLLRAHPPQRLARRRPRNGPPEAVRTRRRTSSGVAPVQHLEQRRVLAVHREQPRAARPRRGQDQLPSRDQGLLVGQRHVAACHHRGVGGHQARGPHDRGHHQVHLLLRRHGHEALRAGEDPHVRRHQRTQAPGIALLGHAHQPHVEGPDLLGEAFLAVLPGGDRPHAEAIREPLHHVQRAFSDGARGAEDREVLHVTAPAGRGLPAYTGRTKRNASTRSSTPPWPGKIVPGILAARTALEAGTRPGRPSGRAG